MKKTWWLVIYQKYEKDAEVYSSKLAARKCVADRINRYYTVKQDYQIVKVVRA